MSQRTVWKYPLETNLGHCEVLTPPGAKLLLFGEQYGKFYVWMEIPDSLKFANEFHYFCIVGTGFDVPPEAEHFQSVQTGDEVWHLYKE